MNDTRFLYRLSSVAVDDDFGGLISLKLMSAVGFRTFNTLSNTN